MDNESKMVSVDPETDAAQVELDEILAKHGIAPELVAELKTKHQGRLYVLVNIPAIFKHPGRAQILAAQTKEKTAEKIVAIENLARQLVVFPHAKEQAAKFDALMLDCPLVCEEVANCSVSIGFGKGGDYRKL